MQIVTEGRANWNLDNAMHTLEIPHEERRIDDDSVEYTVDLSDEDALALAELAR